MKTSRRSRSGTAPHAIGNAATAAPGSHSDSQSSSPWMGERRVEHDDEAKAQRERGVTIDSPHKAQRRGRATESKRGQQ